MIFTTTSLFIAGLIATIIPIAIHLLSKGKPKKIVFPALRFTQATYASTRRRVTLKRLLQLAVRIALVVALGLALARPIIAPRSSSGVSRESEAGTLAAIVVVDSSPRMARVRNNASLFDSAVATARAIVEQLPKDAQIAILSGDALEDAFQTDRVAAKTRLEKLTITHGGRSAADSSRAALALSEKSEASAREIYILSDATRESWNERETSRFQRAYDGAEVKPTLYFVDLGDSAYRNASITDLALSAETLSSRSSLRVDVDVERVADVDAELALEILLFNFDALPEKTDVAALANNDKNAYRRETQTLTFSSGRSRQSAVFYLANLPVGTTVGLARILGADALELDNARPFVVETTDDWKTLVVAPEPVDERALFLTQALAPDDERRLGRAPFELETLPYGAADDQTPRSLFSLAPRDLQAYRAVMLLDPPPLDDATIAKLTAYVEAGGGLAVFLGAAVQTNLTAFQSADVVRLLGAKPVERVRASTQLAPQNYDAPILAPFRPFARDEIPWDAAPVYQYWRLDELAESATVVAPYLRTENNQTGDPAVLENLLGLGVVATTTTPISDLGAERSWNALVSGDAPWIFLLLVDGIARRVASGSASILNYEPGERVAVRAPIKDFPAVATITTPDGEEIATPTDVERRQIRFPGATTPGVYRAHTRPNARGEAINAAFAVASRAEEFELARYSDEEWRRLWRETPYKTLELHAATSELDKARRAGRSEPYVALIILLAALVVLDVRLSDRFYKK
ncbi:MAG: BatA domain-containing protein [Thermoguttaceae bacterium]|nr:BatA domain-containing protein [Thermoguttaceae bacterium]